MSKLTKRHIRSDVRTNPNYRKASLKKKNTNLRIRQKFIGQISIQSKTKMYKLIYDLKKQVFACHDWRYRKIFFSDVKLPYQTFTFV